MTQTPKEKTLWKEWIKADELNRLKIIKPIWKFLIPIAKLGIENTSAINSYFEDLYNTTLSEANKEIEELKTKYFFADKKIEYLQQQLQEQRDIILFLLKFIRSEEDGLDEEGWIKVQELEEKYLKSKSKESEGK